MNDIHEMLRISSNGPISNSPSSNDPNNWNKNKGLTLGNFKTGGKLISVVQPIQARTTLFSFSKKGCCIVQGFFNLTIIEIIVPNGLRFSQLTIQPLRQGHPPQIVASWFIDMFYFRSVIVDNRFKKNSQNLLDIIKKTIHYGLNLSEFARELVLSKMMTFSEERSIHFGVILNYRRYMSKESALCCVLKTERKSKFLMKETKSLILKGDEIKLLDDL